MHFFSWLGLHNNILYRLLCYHWDCKWCKPDDKSVLTENSGLVADTALIAVVFETNSTLEAVKHNKTSLFHHKTVVL